jgi:hypothetical protein
MILARKDTRDVSHEKRIATNHETTKRNAKVASNRFWCLAEPHRPARKIEDRFLVIIVFRNWITNVCTESRGRKRETRIHLRSVRANVCPSAIVWTNTRVPSRDQRRTKIPLYCQRDPTSLPDYSAYRDRSNDPPKKTVVFYHWQSSQDRAAVVRKLMTLKVSSLYVPLEADQIFRRATSPPPNA